MILSSNTMRWYFTLIISAVHLASVSSSFLQQISNFGQKAPVPDTTDSTISNEPEPHLHCILFGEPACQITCNVVCDMYGCTSNGTCLHDTSCDCQEKYNIFEANVTNAEYRNLSLDQLWNYQFHYTNASVNLLATIRNNTELSEALLTEMRNPHKMPQDIITQLSLFLPSGDFDQLQPIQRGVINDYVTANKSFEYEKFRRYLEQKLDNLTDETFDQLKVIQHKDTFMEILKYVKTEEEVKYVLRQLFLFPSDFVKVFAQENGYDINDVLQMTKRQRSGIEAKLANGNNVVSSLVHTTEDIHEIMLSGILEMFIELISGYTD